jgi:FkbM family methyltransferase
MVTLTGLIRTFRVAAQPLDCLPYPNQKNINFKNGWILDLSFAQFRDVRDSYNSLRNYAVTQIDAELFEVDYGNFSITANIKTVCAFADLLHNHPEYTITKLSDDLFRLDGAGIKLEGSSSMVGVFSELQADEYKTDFNNKAILDIGGFQGESAVYFKKLGAKKVVIYEPAKEYCNIIQNNVNINGMDAEVHHAGIGTTNTIMTMDIFDPNLKIGEKQKKEIVKIKNIIDIINESQVDIAKFDCEGAEICLTAVPNEVLRKIRYYILELHGEANRKAITSKLMAAGYKIVKIRNKGTELTIVHFRLFP